MEITRKFQNCVTRGQKPLINSIFGIVLKTIDSNRKTMKTIERQCKQQKDNKNNRHCNNCPCRRNSLIKTKVLTKFQVYIYISCCSHFTAISSICHLYSLLTIKSSFCEHVALRKTVIASKLKGYIHEIYSECVKYKNMKSKR